MSKVNVLFFAADPHSVPPDGRSPRLLLDQDVREIRRKVRAAEYRDTLDFDWRLAARPDDLIQALAETRPQVVHFSGHGNRGGLVLVSPDGARPHPVGTAALKQLFEVFRGDIRVVVLNACWSLPQARAIADVVGCAIGTRGSISDEAAIAFGASFYRALAFGHSVQTAFDQASTALAMEHGEFRKRPVLVARKDVDPAQLVLIPAGGADAGAGVTPRDPATRESVTREEEEVPRPHAVRPSLAARARRWVRAAAGAVALAAGYVILGGNPLDGDPPERCEIGAPGRLGIAAGLPAARPSAKGAAAPSATGPATTSAEPVDGAPETAELASAKDLYEAGFYTAALPLFRRAAENGDAEAMGFLGVMLLNARGTARDPAEAIRLLRKAAGKRDAHAMHALAGAYERGDGVDRSDRWAMHWYRRAAEQEKYAPAMSSLGRMYRLGLGVDADPAEALRWYRKAMEAGWVDAMVEAGIIHQQGLAGAPDAREALRLYCAAAKAGSARGMVAIALMYEHGDGVPREDEEAGVWYRKGAEAGSPQAMNNLGVLYENGRGVPRSRETAVHWFRRAAAAGHAVAAANLAALQRGAGPDPPGR